MKSRQLQEYDKIFPGDLLRSSDGYVYVVVNFDPFTAVHVIHQLDDRKDWERLTLEGNEGSIKEYDHRASRS